MMFIYEKEKIRGFLKKSIDNRPIIGYNIKSQLPSDKFSEENFKLVAATIRVDTRFICTISSVGRATDS